MIVAASTHHTTRAGLDVQQSLDGISRLLHREQRKLLWASLKHVLEAEATETDSDAAHALIQRMVSCASSESPGTQELAAILLEMFLEAAHAGSSTAAGGLCSFPSKAPA